MAALAVVAMLASAWMWPVIDEVETGITPEYPEIQPHYYSTDPQRIYEEVVAGVEDLSGWEIADDQLSVLRINARRHGTLWGVDEVTVRVEPVTEFVSQVHVKSASSGRLSPTDFGRNARNIEQFLGELDRRLGAVKFEPGQPDSEEQDDEPTEVLEEEVGEG